jgi:hypothetical protein
LDQVSFWKASLFFWNFMNISSSFFLSIFLL